MQAAVGAYGDQDEELWIKFLQSRLKEGKSYGNVYWRATRALHDPHAFVQKCQTLNMPYP